MGVEEVEQGTPNPPALRHMWLFFISIPLMLVAIAIATVPLVATSKAEERQLKATVVAARSPAER